jgi:hypothetical protein
VLRRGLLHRRTSHTSESLSENDFETLREGALGAGLLASVGDLGFFDTSDRAHAPPHSSVQKPLPQLAPCVF